MMNFEMDAKLYVGNLAYSTTEAELRLLFAQAGQVTSVTVIKDKDSGQSRGFAFVTMGTQAEARKAIGMFDAFALADRKLKINLAKARESPGGYQSRFSAFAPADRGLEVSAYNPGEARGGYQSRFSAFGNGSSVPKPRRRGGSQRN